MSGLAAASNGGWPADARRAPLPGGLMLAGTLASGLPIGAALVNPAAGLVAAMAVLAGALAVAAIVWPALVTSALVAAIALNLSDILSLQHAIFGTGKAMVAAAALAVAIHALSFGKVFVVDRRGLAALLIYSVIAGLSVFWAHEPHAALEQADALFRNALIAILILIAAGSFDMLGAIARSLYLALTLLAAIAVFQVATGRFDMDFGGLGGAGIHHIAGEIDSLRVHGPYVDANSFGRILLIGIPFAILDALRARSGWWRLAGAVGATLLVLGVVYTYSRGAMLGIAVMALAAAWCWRRHWRFQLTLAVPLALAAALLLPQTYLDRAASVASVFADSQTRLETDQSILNRLEENALAIEMFTDHPWGGVGRGGYQALFQKYSLAHNKYLRFEDRNAHSLYLELAAEGGLLALLAFFSFVAVLFVNVATARQPANGRQNEAAGLAGAIALALIGYLAASTVLHADFSRLFWLLCGMALALPVCARPASNQITQRDLVIAIPPLSAWPIFRHSNMERAIR